MSRSLKNKILFFAVLYRAAVVIFLNANEFGDWRNIIDRLGALEAVWFLGVALLLIWVVVVRRQVKARDMLLFLLTGLAIAIAGVDLFIDQSSSGVLAYSTLGLLVVAAIIHYSPSERDKYQS